MKLFTPKSHQLQSSAIEEIYYERRRRRLLVVFRSGTRYEYGLVEPRTYRELLRAPSAGRFFVQHIRNEYPYRKIS